jgi:hypothetical protein
MQFKGPAFPSWKEPTATTRTLQTHHTLAPGEQYVPHESANGKAAQRRRRQMARDQAKRLRKQYGSDVVEGIDPQSGGLLLNFTEKK